MTTAEKNVTSPMSQTAVDQQQHQLQQQSGSGSGVAAITQQHPAPPVVRITLASMEECNVLLHNGLDFYGATFFPVEAASPLTLKKKPLSSNRYRHNILFNSNQIRKLKTVGKKKYKNFDSKNV